MVLQAYIWSLFQLIAMCQVKQMAWTCHSVLCPPENFKNCEMRYCNCVIFKFQPVDLVSVVYPQWSIPLSLQTANKSATNSLLCKDSSVVPQSVVFFFSQ